jgi:hypothetical protein
MDSFPKKIPKGQQASERSQNHQTLGKYKSKPQGTSVPRRMVIIKKSDNTKDGEKLKLLEDGWWECKMAHLLWDKKSSVSQKAKLRFTIPPRNSTLKC